jgi:hypothetical protein
LITYNKKLIQETGVSPIASKPKILVWQYFGNDVDFTASNFGVYPKYEEGLSDNLLEFLFQGRLFVLDYIYWHLLKSKPEAEYKNYLTRCYSGEEMHTPSGDVGTIKATHMKPVIDIVRTCATDSISFLLVVFPIMTDIKFSEDLYSKEIELQCKRAHVNVVNLSSVFSRYKTEDLIVSPNNPHPSKFAHRIAADTIYRYMLKEGMLD